MTKNRQNPTTGSCLKDGERMYDFNISLAGRIIAVSTIYPGVQIICRDYIAEGGPADFQVVVTQKDIDFEREKSAREDMQEFGCVHKYPAGYLETLAVYRQIAEKLLDYDTLLFHGSTISVDGEGYVFTAKSGTGKSTHTRFWRETFGDRLVMVNDDKPLLRVTDEGVIAYGTPWDGKHHLSTNTSVPLKAICVLNRAEDNHIEPLSISEAFPMLLQQTYRPQDPVRMMKVMALLEKLMHKTQLYNLGCNLNPEAAMVAYNGMNRKD